MLTPQQQQQLLERFAPVVWLHSSEDNLPSSVDYFLENAELVDGDGNVVLPQVGTAAALAAAGATADYRLRLRSASARAGTGADAPAYGTIRDVLVDGVLHAYDLTYWFFYPFNGNIFDFAQMRLYLELAIAAGGVLSLIPFFPVMAVGVPVLGAASAGLAFLNSVSGIQIHEGDWEHVTVRVTLDQHIVAVYYAAHAGEGQWHREAVPVGDNSKSGYQLDGDHPIVYSARHSHASYSWAGTKKRVGGLANDTTSQGTRWNTFNNLINLGHDVANPPPGQEWLAFPGRWGRAGTKPLPTLRFLSIEDTTNQVVEWVGGPQGPAFQNSWTMGDPMPPDIWPYRAQLVAPMIFPTETMAATAVGLDLILIEHDRLKRDYALSFRRGGVWTRRDGLLPFLDPAVTYFMTLAARENTLHLFYAANKPFIGWATLDTTTRFDPRVSWQPQTFPLPAGSPSTVSAAVLGGDLYLLGNRADSDQFFFFRFDGTTWTDLSATIPAAWRGLTEGEATALAAFGDDLYAGLPGIFPGLSAEMVGIGRYNPSTGWAPQLVGHTPPNKGKAFSLAAFDDFLYMVHAPQGNVPILEGRMWSRYNPATGWSPSRPVLPAGLVLPKTGQALAAANDDPQLLELFFVSPLATVGTLSVGMPR